MKRSEQIKRLIDEGEQLIYEGLKLFENETDLSVKAMYATTIKVAAEIYMNNNRRYVEAIANESMANNDRVFKDISTVFNKALN